MLGETVTAYKPDPLIWYFKTHISSLGNNKIELHGCNIIEGKRSVFVICVNYILCLMNDTLIEIKINAQTSRLVDLIYLAF